MEKVIMHIDVNNAFLSWTAVDLIKQGESDIRLIDSVIGGDVTSRKGIVLSKSQSAKEKGIITGERLTDAFRKCPTLKNFPPNFNLYSEMSASLFNLLLTYSPDIEIFSIDECFLDYGKVKNLYGDEIVFASKISKEIKDKLGFTVNIGIGNNKLCAKMASDFSKPNKIHTLYIDEVKDKMWPLPIESLFGIGKKTSLKLHELNINTIGDLAQSNYEHLYKHFKNQALSMIESANGIDYSEVISTSQAPKGISNSTTFERDLDNKKDIYKIIDAICDNVASSLRSQNKYTKVIAVSLKDSFFHSYSHQKKLLNATDLTNEISEVARKLFDEMWRGEPIRLVGVRLDSLVDNVNHQLSLFESIDNRDRDNSLEKVVDDIKAKYGSKALKRASLINNKINKKYLK